MLDPSIYIYKLQSAQILKFSKIAHGLSTVHITWITMGEI